MAKRPIPPPYVLFLNDDGTINRVWYEYLLGRDNLDFSDLRDVDMATTAPTNGQVPIYNSTSKKWLPGAN